MQRKLIYGVHPRSFIGNARAAGDLFSRLDPDYVWINPNEDGVFDFARILGDKAWEIHIDLTHPGASFAMNMEESLKIR